MEVKGNKFPLWLVWPLLILLLSVLALLALIAPIAGLVILINMSCNRGRINFQPKKEPATIKKKKSPFDFEPIKL